MFAATTANRHDLMESIADETRRRLDILCQLYRARRDTPDDPGLSVLEIGNATGLPHEKLVFTLNYLREKEFIHQDEKTDFVITAAGMDLVEKQVMR
ncbi:MAG: hypothetical protein LAO79_14790 [Acidobacteriia bacterium]|nr:hypothetical protein [Terriglobia bacterium]